MDLQVVLAPGTAPGMALAGTGQPAGACAAVIGETERAIDALEATLPEIPAHDTFRRAMVQAGLATQTRQLARLGRLAVEIERGKALPEPLRIALAEAASAHLTLAATARGTALARAHRLFLSGQGFLRLLEAALR